MAEEERPDHISAGVRRLLQEATQLGQALDLVVATQGSGSPAVAPLLRELTGTHRVLSTAFEESTAAPLLTAAAQGEAEAPEVERVEDRLEQTEARLSALRISIAQLLQRLERKETPLRQQEKETPLRQQEDDAVDLESRNTELGSEVARHRDIEISLLTTMREIRGASRAKSDFLANMSHELRTPLNAIIGFAEIMETELVGPLGSEQYVGYAKDVRESGQYMLDLINDILDLSKIESGQMDVVEGTIDLHATLEACLHMVHDQAEEAKLDINLEVGENLPKIRANARMLRQILLNVLSNAIKFTPSGGGIAVSLLREDDTGDLVLSVRDSGIGIAPADIERVMQPFEQVASAQATGYRGTGLGLPTAKSLIELHGGTFSIDSKVDLGTTATIRLPAERTIEAE